MRVSGFPISISERSSDFQTLTGEVPREHEATSSRKSTIGKGPDKPRSDIRASMPGLITCMPLKANYRLTENATRPPSTHILNHLSPRILGKPILFRNRPSHFFCRIKKNMYLCSADRNLQKPGPGTVGGSETYRKAFTRRSFLAIRNLVNFNGKVKD